MSFKINPQLLKEWKQQGKLLTIFRCERCYKKTPFFDSHNDLINSIYTHWVRSHKYCWKCEKKLKKSPINPDIESNIKPEIDRIIERYEPPKQEVEDLVYT